MRSRRGGGTTSTDSRPVWPPLSTRQCFSNALRQPYAELSTESRNCVHFTMRRHDVYRLQARVAAAVHAAVLLERSMQVIGAGFSVRV